MSGAATEREELTNGCLLGFGMVCSRGLCIEDSIHGVVVLTGRRTFKRRNLLVVRTAMGHQPENVNANSQELQFL